MDDGGEIPGNCRCLATRPRGKKPKKGWQGNRADPLVRFRSAWNQRAWQGVALARLTLENQEGEGRGGPVEGVRRGALSQRPSGLRVARNLAPAEGKYFLSNAPAATTVEKRLRVAFPRWNVEPTVRVAKSAIGFGPFEGRSAVALRRPMMLCLVGMGFVAEHTERLRGEKAGDPDGARVPRAEPTLPGLAGEPPRDNGSSTHSRSHRLAPAASSRCPTSAPEAANAAAELAL
jgi:hypothetical protein